LTAAYALKPRDDLFLTQKMLFAKDNVPLGCGKLLLQRRTIQHAPISRRVASRACAMFHTPPGRCA
jgi:hypothetical protein